jgi:hypothetical protein
MNPCDVDPCDAMLRIPADFLREARRLFGRLRLADGARFPVEVCGAFDGIRLALGDGRCWLESFRHAIGRAGGHGRVLLPWPVMADACRADPGTLVELAACRQGAGTRLRLGLRQGGARFVRFHSAAGGPVMAAPALPDGASLRLPARSMEALAAVAPFADWQAAAGPWRSGVCFSPADGGCLIAGNARCLARVPLELPVMAAAPGLALPFERPFVLPLGALRVLLHPDFLGYENQLTLPCPGEEPRVMFRAWSHLLVTPVLPPGLMENDAMPWVDAAISASRHLALDAVRRAQLLGWLRALRDPQAPVSLIWRAEDGRLSVVQGRRRGRGARLVLPPRDLAAALEFGGTLVVGEDHAGRMTLYCRTSGGAFCRIASLAGAAEGGRVGRAGGRRPAA